MKVAITITAVKTEHGMWGTGRLVITGDGVEFRVIDNEQSRKAYAIGRVVDVEIKPRKP